MTHDGNSPSGDDDCMFPGLDDLLATPRSRSGSPDEIRITSNLSTPPARQTRSPKMQDTLDSCISEVGGTTTPTQLTSGSFSCQQHDSSTACTPQSPSMPKVYTEVNSDKTMEMEDVHVDDPNRLVSFAEVVRLQDASAAAWRTWADEMSVLREENERLRAAHTAAEREIVRLRQRAEADHCEIDSLHTQLNALRRSAAGSPGFGKRRPGRPKPASPKVIRVVASSTDDDCKLARRLAAIELESLTGIVGEERARLRRRLQLKWHPDKNTHNSEFATMVLQEMQQQSEWH